MSSSLIITLEMLGVLGVVVGLGCWELWSLRRERARDRERALRGDGPAARDADPQ
jgi:hypothetical protein